MFRPFSICLLLCALASGCGVLSGTPSTTIYVRSAPPPPQPEPPMLAAPGADYLWVAGYWDSVDGHFAWRAGHWVPRRPDCEYVRASYRLEGGSWVFHRPGWKRQVSPAALPASAQEAKPRG